MTPSIALFVQSVLEFVLQLLLFCAIPFAVFLITKRTWRGFRVWIGLKRAPIMVVLIAMGVAAVIAGIQAPLLRSFLGEAGTVSGGLAGHHQEHGWSVWLVGALLVTACLQTALTEEIFFRGFVGARLIARLGFAWGNAVQAIIFGSIHLMLLTVLPPEQRTVAVGALVLLGPTAAGWIMGYVNYRFAGGSILPSWAMHGLGNTIAYTVPLVIA